MLNERKLTKTELDDREEVIMNMKKNKRALVKKYGKDAEAVMYGRATNIAKNKTENMNQDKVREMIKDSLKNPKKADLNKDGKLSDYEKKRGAAIEKNLDESSSTEEKRIAKMAIKKLAKYRDVGEDEARQDLIRAAKELGDLNEGVRESLEDDWAAVAPGIPFTPQNVKIFQNAFFAGDNTAKIGNKTIKIPKVDLNKNNKFLSKDQKIDFNDPEYKDLKNQTDKLAKDIGLSESNITENKQEAFDELQMIMDQLYELSDQAKMIFRNNFPTEYRRLDAYGALDFGTSSNRYDVTLEGALENLDMEEDDEDLMEGKDSTHKVKYSKSNDTYQVWLGDKIVTDFATEEKADAEAKRLNALQDAKKIDKAQVGEDLDLGHQDNEPHMLKGDLYKIGKYAMELYQMVGDFEYKGEVDFPHWWQSKITTAKNMISGAKHYLDFELKEPAIDAVVDKLSSISNGVEVDVVDNVEINEEEPGKSDMVASAIQKAMNKHKGDDAKIHQLKKARTAMNKGDLSKAEKIAKRLAEKLKSK